MARPSPGNTPITQPTIASPGTTSSIARRPGSTRPARGGRRPSSTGRYDDAASLLERVRRRIESYAGDDPELRRIVESLRVDFGVYAMSMMPMDRKMRYSEASYALRSRDAGGMARREKSRQ